MVTVKTLITPQTTVCPVTGLPVYKKPEWTDMDCGESYSVTFRLVGERILINSPAGNSGKNGMNRLFEKRAEVLREAGLIGEKYVEIKDYSRITGATTREGRQQFTRNMIKERESGNLLGYWGYNASWFVKLAFNVGLKITKITFPVVIVNTYKEAIENAVTILKENNLISTSSLVHTAVRDDWRLALDGFSVDFKIIDNDIIYTEDAGALEEHHVKPFFSLLRKILAELRLPDGKYYRIANWSNIKKSTWKARSLYVEGIKTLQKEYPCRYSVIFGLNKFMRVMTNITHQFIPFEVIATGTFEEALEIIERKKQNKIPVQKKEPVKHEITDNTLQEYISKLLYFLGTINWEHDGIDAYNEQIIENHPLRAIYESIALIKQDFDAVLREKNDAVEILRENEERFRIMFESSHDLITILDSNNTILWGNASWRDKLGYLPETLTDPFQEIHPDDKNRFTTAWKLMTEGTSDITNLEYRYRTARGVYIYLETTVRELNTSSQRLFFVISHDITERVKAEEEKLLLEEELRQSEKTRAIGQLAGGIAHDFNNQLAGIVGYTDIIRRRIVADRHLYAYVDKIQGVVNRASGLTAQLLAFARKGKYQIVPVNIHDVIKEVICLVEHTFDKRITVKQELHAEVPVTLGDPTQLQNAFLNMTINARDAMPEGGECTFTTETVIVDSEKKDRTFKEITPGRYVKIEISDTGVGIQKDVQDLIFEPFYTTKKEGKGTGMGLAAVYGTIRNHNGTIRVISEEGKGAVFTIYLPVNEEKPVKRSDTLSPPPASECSAHIFFIDDEDMVVEIMTDILNDMGYRVTTSQDGNDAVRQYSKLWREIDLVVLDMVMPGLNGKDIYREIRTINPRVKVIVSSGYSIDNEMQKILDDGALSFVQKPYRIDSLLEKISDAFKC